MQNLVKALLFGPSPSPFVCVTSLPWNFLGPFFTRQRGRERDVKVRGERGVGKVFFRRQSISWTQITYL